MYRCVATEGKKKKSKDVSVIVYPGEIAKATGQNISKQFYLEKNL